MYGTIRDFAQALERAGELRRVGARVSPVLEVTEIAHRQSRLPAPSLPADATRRTDPRFHHLGGHAVLFEQVEGSAFPVLINAFGSYRRMEMALGCGEGGRTEGGLEGLAERIGRLARPEPPSTMIGRLQKIPELMELSRIPPRRVRAGICQDVVIEGDEVDLRRLPLVRCWPLDGDLGSVGHDPGANAGTPGVESGEEWERSWRGRYVTFAGVHTIHADDAGEENLGMYRVQLLGRRTMAMHWHVHHDGARHWRSWRDRGRAMPVAIALGGESVLSYAATAPMPPGISELLLAGFLNGGAIPLVRARTVPIDVPANAEIVIEGLVGAPAGGGFEDALEGPFGDHTGYYSLPERYPLLRVTAITHRRGAIFPATVVGPPPQEDYFMGKATERLFLPLLRTIVPDIIDYDLPMFGAFHNCAFVRIRKEYPLHARRVMHAIWGAGQMSWTKCIVVVDDDVDVHDHDAVLFHACANADPGRDVEVVRGPLDVLDHAAPRLGAGSKIGIDATRKIAGEEARGEPVRGWPPLIRMDEPTVARVTARWREYGF
jgi:4-hydroxy-3-polyprenylbenzoate decarboxylase